MFDIRKVAVLGAGTMGARIAAHLANSQVPSLLLDIVPPDVGPEEQSLGRTLGDPMGRNRIAKSGLDAALKSRPPAFFIPDAARMITVGNFEDHLQAIRDCDWIIEAVTEDLQVKCTLLEKVEQFRSPGAIVSSNTSGISIARVAESASADFRKHFLGTHFFNPPRYMKLLEIIPTAQTLPDVVKAISRFGELVLGKGIVIAKDTPNFIANRLGTFFTLNVLHEMQRGGYSIEEIDVLTGPILGLPKSATFRTVDLVGLDVLAHVVKNLKETLRDDERRDVLELPGFFLQMLERKLLGEKTGHGFYKKIKSPPGQGGESEIRTLDLKTFEYRPRQRPNLPSLDLLRNVDDARQRIRNLVNLPDRSGDFYRKVLGDTFYYAANRIPEIADTTVSVDNAMKWGFNWECGIFEMWDAVGVSEIASQWRNEGRSLPPLVEKLLGCDGKAFYTRAQGITSFFDVGSGQYRVLPQDPECILLASLKGRNAEIKKNPGASLIDLGDGVLCLEFHSKMNTIGPDTVQMVHAGLKMMNDSFEAMVIANQAPNFCAGANLLLLLTAIQEGDWEEIHHAVRTFQNVNMALKYAPKPVVAAPAGLTLGGGVEICLHSARVHAAAEAYMGLVEMGVGLIPGGGGTKEMLLRAMDASLEEPDADPFAFLRPVLETLGKGRVSNSAEEARRLGYLSARDSITLNRDRQIAGAKQLALDIVKLGYRPGKPRDNVRALGQPAFAKIKLGLHLLKRAEYITEYDAVVGMELARVLCGGGEFTSSQQVSEQYLLDLEREAFVRLCGQRKTAERIQFMLKKGKPLRN